MATLTATPSVHVSVDGATRAAGGRVPHMRGVRKSLSHQLSPSTSASIPSRYQTFFYATTEKKGFNSRATRFTTPTNVNDNPGPGTYVACTDSLQQTHSYSRKGMGGFASKTKRFPKERKQVLGPGSYNPQPVDNSHDFNSGVGSNFCKPIAVREVRRGVHESPSPNTYNLSGVHTGKNTVITAESAFKSRSQREVLHSVSTPSPGHYSVQDDLLHHSARTHQAVFNSRSKRESLGRPAMGPGPADYSPYPATNNNRDEEPKQLPYYRQKHYLCISAPAMPLAPLPPSPGPGHYETHEPPEPQRKKLLGGAVFCSTTSRWDRDRHASSAGPGPGAYDPIMFRKRSYLYNAQHKWI